MNIACHPAPRGFYSVIKISFIFISHKLDLTMLERIPGFQTQLHCVKYFVELSALMSTQVRIFGPIEIIRELRVV